MKTQRHSERRRRKIGRKNEGQYIEKKKKKRDMIELMVYRA
jgi:hypothetical protein